MNTLPHFLETILKITLLSLTFSLVTLSLLTRQSPTQAQTDFRIEHLPLDHEFELTSYVDHDGERSWGVDSSGTFMFMNGDIYSNRLPYFYDGHDGIDWASPMSTTVRSVVTGTIVLKDISPFYGYRIEIDHGDYRTAYSHLLPFTSYTFISITRGQTVTMGQPIALSGNTAMFGGVISYINAHLDFEVLHDSNDQRTDPFGWRGEPGQDPLAYNGVDSQCLWNNEWCQETIVEDGDYPITRTAHYEEEIVGKPVENIWSDTGGHQSGARYLWSGSPYAFARWKPTLPMRGRYEIFAFIPPANATTQNALYKISTVNGLITATVNQNAHIPTGKLGWQSKSEPFRVYYA